MSKRAEWLCLGVIVGLLLGALGYVSFRHKLPSPSVFAIDSKVDSSNTPIFAAKNMDCHADFQSARNDRKNAICENAVSLENKRQRCKAKPQQVSLENKGYRSPLADVSLEKADSSYFAIPNPTPSAHASTIIALDTARVAPHLRDSYGFMALFFAGSREGARDVGIYQSFFIREGSLESTFSKGDSVLLKKHRLSPTASLVLGRHSADLANFGTTADHQSSSAPKFAKGYESPTATPRILEEDNQGECEKSAASLENKGYRSALADVSLENKRQRCKAKPKQVSLEKVDSSDEAMDCHAAASAASRNDNKKAFFQNENFNKNAQILNTLQNAEAENVFDKNAAGGRIFLKVDSRKKAESVFDKNAKNLNKSQAEGFEMGKQGVAAVSLVNRGFQARGEGSYLVGNDRDPSEESTIYRKKPTPKTQKKPTPKPHWSTPREILTPAILSRLSGKFIAKLGNPVSFVDTLGRVHLFVVGVSLGGWATSRVYWLEFDESLEHLHFRQELALSPFANLSFLVRSPALLLEDGGFILPIYHELARKYPLLVRFDSALRLESTFLPLPHIGAKSLSKLQPSFTPLSATKAIGVYRNYTPSAMQVSLCQLQGDLSCQPPKPSNLINYNSSSVLFSVDGLVFLLHNSPPPTRYRQNLLA
ncbi:exo-alpha-sialidase [Helicobacter canis]|uniref:Neuraminidase n=1 Tax=Helicobacter canis TaxID=29419 RepID=A0A377J5N4_9HELI|nr:exo-alpha-sialidase [Helicobacter canis]STO97146.1 neuraminidase [Helicobacter canis]